MKKLWKLEKKYVDKLPEIAPLWNELEGNHESIEYAIVKLADSLSVLAYSNREIDLGNQTKEMIEINVNAKNRIIQWKNELEGRL